MSKYEYIGVLKGEIIVKYPCECGSNEFVLEPILLSSMPPQEKLRCTKCGAIKTVVVEELYNKKEEEIKYWRASVENSLPRFYRAWAKHSQQMFYDIKFISAESVLDPHWIYMPGIGMDDENGTPIYLGDVVKYRDFEQNISYYAVVLYSYGSYVFKNSWLTGYRLAYYRDIVVVGNVFENPDLIDKYDI